MASQQGIKRRIKSVSNTRQITKAMQMVAASKLRKAQEKSIGPKAYINAAGDLLENLGSTSEAQHHPLFQARKLKTGLVIAITSNKGLAGAYNSNVLRALNKFAIENKVDQKVISIGRYVAMHVARVKGLDELAAYDVDTGLEDITTAQPVLEQAIDQFINERVDNVTLIYTKYISTVKQEVSIEQLLPLKAKSAQQTGVSFEPGPDVLLDLVVRRLLEAKVLQAILESQASEQASRMLAMQNATDNAKDLIDDLKLVYNNARQSAITQEIAEITSGTEAMNG